MSVIVKEHLEDGATVVVDTDDRREFVLTSGQLEQMLNTPSAERRALVERLVDENRADPTGGRTEVDEQTVETAQNTGDAGARNP